MQKKLQAKLYRKYPELFQDRKKPGSETRMCDGICCDAGWYELIADACLQLRFINQHFEALYTFFQVKEKLGGLRIYINQPQYGYPLPKKIKVIICKMVHCIKHFAECQSYCTCEKCGGYRHGAKTLGTWIYALCDKCWVEFKKEKKIVSKKKRINKR